MADTTTIIAGKELLDIAIEFQKLVSTLNETTVNFSNKSMVMESRDFYDGRNRENLDLGNYAAVNHLNNLTEFYGLCFAYIMYAYEAMINLDQELAVLIQLAYIEEHYGK